MSQTEPAVRIICEQRGSPPLTAETIALLNELECGPWYKPAGAAPVVKAGKVKAPGATPARKRVPFAIPPVTKEQKEIARKLLKDPTHTKKKLTSVYLTWKSGKTDLAELIAAGGENYSEVRLRADIRDWVRSMNLPKCAELVEK